MKTEPSQFPFNSAMFIRPGRIAPSAWFGHVPFAAWLMAAVNPRIFVELGSHWGVSYAAFCQSAAENGNNSKCYAVDTWTGDEHAGFYPEDVFRSLNEFNEQCYSSFSRLMRMTFDEAAAYFGDGTVDLLHIDGLHTYEAVKHDFATWLPKLSDRAIVLFHDTEVRERGFGVWKLWEELARQYPHLRFDHSHGLGVLFVGARQTEDAQKLIAHIGDGQTLQRVRQMFAALGESVLCRWELECARYERNDTVGKLQTHIAALSEELRRRDAAIESPGSSAARG